MISFYPPSVDSGMSFSVADCIVRGLFSGGYYSDLLTKLFLHEMDVSNLILTPSCTSAIHMALRLAHIHRGDEVILPSFNFPAAANAVLLCGGVPVLCDIDSSTQNISVEDAAHRITRKTKAVIAVHYAAVACDMGKLNALCEKFSLALIEDAAQAVGAAYKGRHLGTMGRFGCYSFHATKVFTSGEGGALCFGAEDAQEAALYRDNGTNRESFMNGICLAYNWQGLGESMRMSELAAAALYPQLIRRDETIQKRLKIQRAYDTAFRDANQSGRLQLMTVPEGCHTNGHIYYVRFADGEERKRVQSALKRDDIPTYTHYVPLHMSPAGAALGYGPKDLPQSKRAYETLLRLPIHEQMTEDQAFYVAERLLKAVEG